MIIYLGMLFIRLIQLIFFFEELTFSIWLICVWPAEMDNENKMCEKLNFSCDKQKWFKGYAGDWFIDSVLQINHFWKDL
jgi:hypothetical protein